VKGKRTTTTVDCIAWAPQFPFTIRGTVGESPSVSFFPKFLIRTQISLNRIPGWVDPPSPNQLTSNNKVQGESRVDYSWWEESESEPGQTPLRLSLLPFTSGSLPLITLDRTPEVPLHQNLIYFLSFRSPIRRWREWRGKWGSPHWNWFNSWKNPRTPRRVYMVAAAVKNEPMRINVNLHSLFLPVSSRRVNDEDVGLPPLPLPLKPSWEINKQERMGWRK